MVHFLLPKESKRAPGKAEYTTVDKALTVVTYNTEKEKEANANIL